MKNKISIVGAESTGKSTLAKQLARHFAGRCVEEYAREYVESIGRGYTEEDVEVIARKQIEQLRAEYEEEYVFFDTELIITKVWFDDKYGRVPQWVEESIKRLEPKWCLLCMPDLPFVYDPVRENPHRREELTERYEQELKKYGIRYYRVCGSGEERLKRAVDIIETVCREGCDKL